ncbi:MAG TPA: hypothetical protein VIU40_15525, partial [Geobacteraceae bacterium]
MQSDKCPVCREPLPSSDHDREPVVHRGGQTLHESCSVEREQVSWVFGLTGGELSDVPWFYAYDTAGEEGERAGRLPECEVGRGVFRHWYDSAPEYATDNFTRDERRSAGADVRTAVVCALYGMPPAVLWDEGDGSRWERAVFYQFSGETECPSRHGDYDLVENDAHTPCPLCEEEWNEPHGWIYLGDGWGEVVYRRAAPRVVWDV